MEAKKNLCGMIPEELHARAVAKEQLGLKTGRICGADTQEHFEGGRITMAETKTSAFKITEELDQRLKNFIAAEKARQENHAENSSSDSLSRR
ncbi:MAG: 4-oxalocrotonate tautomerase [Hydrogeniiclostridium mannosilyticum]